MPVNPAVQTLYSAQVLANLDPAHVWADACNTNYEGEVKGQGDVLKIFTVGRPTPASYTVGTTTITYERIRPADQVLKIDQDTHWAIAEDYLEAMLSKIDTLNELAKEGAWALVDGSDVFLAKAMAAAAGTTHTSSQIGNGASDLKAYDLMEQMAEDVKNASATTPMDLHFFCPFWFMTFLRTDVRFSGFGTDASRRTARGERIVELAGLTIHETANALDSAGTGVDVDGPINTVICCSKRATTWGRHIPEEGMVQFLDSNINPDNFDKRMRARYVYGATVVYPQLIVKCVVTKGST